MKLIAPRSARRAGRSRGTRRPTAAQQRHEGRELVVVADGPWAQRWYWRDDLEAMQTASRHVGHLGTHPAGQLRRYRPTDDQQPHPHNTERSGRIYRYGPAENPAATGPAAEQVARAGAAVTAAVVPTPRRPLDDEMTERERRRYDRHTSESADHGARSEGVWWWAPTGLRPSTTSTRHRRP